LVSRLEQARRDAPQERLLAERLTAVRERDNDGESLAEETAELVLGLRQPARGERGPLRVERERLPLRQRRKLGRAGEVRAGKALLLPDRAHLVRRPDEIDGAVERRDEVVGDHERLLLVLLGTQVDLQELAQPLARRVDGRLVDLPQRALREGRESADLFDLVPEKLDAERLAAGRREDVDEPAADGELPALL